jgi:hypothetical protein
MTLTLSETDIAKVLTYWRALRSAEAKKLDRVSLDSFDR